MTERPNSQFPNLNVQTTWLTSESKRDDSNKHDLEERTFAFALSVRQFISSCQWGAAQQTDIRQLLRSCSGSVAANYTEANNSSSRKEFAYRMSVTKREASESRLWIRLLGSTSESEEAKDEARRLLKETDELTRIRATIHSNCHPSSEDDV
jgi:four helix bundle protein